MALNSENVLVALTGAVYVAPVGTAPPVDAEVAWAAAWVDLGYLDESGIVEAPNDERSEIKAWQNGDTVREMITGSKTVYSITLLETTVAGLGLYYPGSEVTGTGDGPATIAIKGPTGGRRAFGFDVIDGDKFVRWTVGLGEVTERGEINYVNDAAVSYSLSITAYPGVDGVIANKTYSVLDGLPVGP
jgi:hypothetical protein